MPHPPLHIWARPRDWSLQLLYLSTFYITMARVLSQNKLRILWTSPTSISHVSGYGLGLFGQGPNTGLQLTDCPTQTGGCGPQLCPHQMLAWQLWAPAVAFALWATVASEGLNPSKWWVGNFQTHHMKAMEALVGCLPP